MPRGNSVINHAYPSVAYSSGGLVRRCEGSMESLGARQFESDGCPNTTHAMPNPGQQQGYREEPILFEAQPVPAFHAFHACPELRRCGSAERARP